MASQLTKSPPPTAKDRGSVALSAKSASKAPTNTTRPAPASHALTDFDHDGMDGAGDDSPAPKAKRGKIAKQDVADMTAQLAIMIKSGVDLSSALNSLATQCDRPALTEVLESINELVVGGNTLSESLKQFPDVFDAAYTATVAAAEASGRMAEVLRQLSDMQRNELRLRRSIVSLMTYPILLTVISSSVITVLVIVVLPRFATIFEQYEAKLPVTTEILIGAAGELQTRWWLWLPMLAAAIFGGLVWRRTEAGRRSIDGFLINCPQIRNVTRPMLVGRLCRMMGLLLSSGVTLLEGLRLCREAVTNLHYKDLLGGLVDSVVNGQGMGAKLQQADIMPASAREMICTAERTGNLCEVTQLLGAYYEEEAENKMKQVVRILEPLITVVMGAVVAFVVLSVMLPIFDLSSLQQGE